VIKTVGLLQRREGLDPAGFREHYESNHAPLAVRLLGFPGYQRNYPESDEARAALGFDGFSEFWFRDEAETAKIGEIMGTEVGAQLLEDEPRFMNVPRNQTYAVSERCYGTRPEPGKTLRALAITRLPAGVEPGRGERKLDLDETRVRERALPGVLASLHIVPEAASMPLPPDMPAAGCVESLWLDSRSALDACNHWRAEAGAPLLWAVEESGTPVMAWPG
jgi:hypothetical protein